MNALPAKAVDCALAVNKTKRETNEENLEFTIMEKLFVVMENSASIPIFTNIHDKNTFSNIILGDLR